MALFNSLRRALGFSGDDDDEVEGIDATVHPMTTHREPALTDTRADNQPDDPGSQPPADDPASPPAEPDDEMKVRIFERVVEIFNDSLPAFLKSAVDPQAQQRYIYEALDQSMRKYLDDLERNARALQRDSWMRERQRLETETRELRERIKEADEKSANYTKQHLSSDRQIRTLKDRIHDLETQIANLEGEKEQFQLENRSLVNKLRVCSVQITDEEVDYATKLQELTEKYEIAQTMINQLTSEASKAKAEAAETSDALSSTREELSKIKEQLEEKSRPVEDPRIKEYEGAIDEMKHQVSELQGQLLQQREDLVKAEEEIQNTRSQLAEANEDLQSLSELEQAVTQFEEVKEAKDTRIKQLSTTNNQLTMVVDSLKSEIAALKRTIEVNLDTQVRNEGELKAQIQQLREEAARRPAMQFEEIPEPPAPIAEPKQKRKRKPKISAIDESIDDTDWLVATPEPGKGIIAEPDPEFGYQAPARKSTPVNDDQLSLW